MRLPASSRRSERRAHRSELLALVAYRATVQCPRHHPQLAYERSATSRKMAVAITTTTANRSHVEGLNGFVSMRTSIVFRHRNVDGVHRIPLEVSAVRPGRGRGIESRERAFPRDPSTIFLETPPLLGKDPALMLRADTTAPVFNDEEKRARATTQVQKLVREGYCGDVGGSAFWAGCDRATTLVAGARHVGSFPHGMCQLSPNDSRPVVGRRGRL
jgi:hypothetical protein